SPKNCRLSICPPPPAAQSPLAPQGRRALCAARRGLNPSPAASDSPGRGGDPPSTKPAPATAPPRRPPIDLAAPTPLWVGHCVLLRNTVDAVSPAATAIITVIRP